MDKTIKQWLTALYEKEIVEVQGSIVNEHTWELGHEGDGPNPHTENIAKLNRYLCTLKKMKNELN